MKPFVKWAGGKRQLIPHLLKYVPDKFDTYFEPFIGGGALFFELAPRIKKAVLADTNPSLINTYLTIQSSPKRLIKILREYESAYLNAKSRADYFYNIRSIAPDTLSQVADAARFIFLNRTCFNGLYRVNRKGLFNAPHGDYSKPRIADEQNIMECSTALVRAEIYQTDFRETLAKAEKGDFVYLDPPYIPLSPTANFSSYTKGGFDLKDHKALADLSSDLKSKGVHVLASGSGSKTTKDLYKNSFSLTPVAARRNINSDAFGRDSVKEYIIH